MASSNIDEFRSWTDKYLQKLWALDLLNPVHLLYIGISIFVAVLVIGPLVVLVVQSFFSESFFETGELGYLTLENYANAYSDPEMGRLWYNTLIIAIGTTVFSTTIGVGMAWVVARTNTPFRKVIEMIMILPYLTPAYLIAVAYIFLFSPQIGWVNSFILEPYLGFTVSVYSYLGIIIVKGISFSTLPFLLTIAAFRNFDPSLEDASRISGAGTLRTLRHITLPLTLPSISAAALLIFTKSLEMFSVPVFLGLSASPPIHVFATRIWAAFSRSVPPEYGFGTALATTLLVIGVVGLVAQRKATGMQEKFTTVTGQGFTPKRYDLGPWRWGTFGIGILILFASVVLPFFLLFIASVSSTWVGKIWLLSDSVNFTLSNYYNLVFNRPRFMTALFNSLLIATVGAFVGMILSSLISYFVIKVKEEDSSLIGGTSSFVDRTSFVPAAVPGIVMATGILWFVLTIPTFGLYGSIWLIMLGYISRKLPEGTRTTHGAITQLDDELEDQARVSGASWFQTIKDIIVPLIDKSFMAGYLLLFMSMIKNLSIPIILYSKDSIVLPVLIFELKWIGRYEELAALGVIMMVLMLTVLFIAEYVFEVDLSGVK